MLNFSQIIRWAFLNNEVLNALKDGKNILHFSSVKLPIGTIFAERESCEKYCVPNGTPAFVCASVSSTNISSLTGCCSVSTNISSNGMLSRSVFYRYHIPSGITNHIHHYIDHIILPRLKSLYIFKKLKYSLIPCMPMVCPKEQMIVRRIVPCSCCVGNVNHEPKFFVRDDGKGSKFKN